MRVGALGHHQLLLVEVSLCEGLPAPCSPPHLPPKQCEKKMIFLLHLFCVPVAPATPIRLITESAMKAVCLSLLDTS